MPALIEFVKSPGSRWFIREGIWTLGKIGPAAKEAVPVIAPYLGSDNSQIRYAAAEALGNIGPAAGAAVPALRLALNDKDSLLRLEAAAALKKIEGR